MNYAFTETGVISKMYGHQKERNKSKGYGDLPYSKLELSVWLYNNGYAELYRAYFESGLNKDLKPSCDRLEDTLGYDFNNMQLVTYRENIDKCYSMRRSGSANHGGAKQYPVMQMTKDKVYINEFHSIAEAERVTGIPKSNISGNCLGKRKTAGGYCWTYKGEE